MLKRGQAGFNLIELLLGVALSMICLLAVTMVMVNFNQHRNTAVQSMEAQSNGAMAHYLMEHDLQQAGYDLMDIGNCTTINYCFSGCAAALSMSAWPVVLTDGGASSDTIEVRYGRSASGAPGTTILADSVAYADPFKVATIVGFAVGDKVVVDVGAKCTMAEVTSIGVDSLSHAVGGFNATSAPSGASVGWDIPTQASKIVNLGSFVDRKYSVSSGTLISADFPSFSSQLRVDGIVYLKAQYGIDTNADGVIDSWAGPSTAITGAAQVLAVRIGLVARSPLLEKDLVAPATLNVLPAITTTPTAAAVSYTVPDKHFRYKVYYSIIPFKNVIWGR